MSSAHRSSKPRRPVAASLALAAALFCARSARAEEPKPAPGDVTLSSRAAVGASTVPKAYFDPTIDVSTITGGSIEFNETTGMAFVEGNAVLTSSTATLKADKLSLDTNEKTGHAVGHVEIISATGTISGSEATYNWETSTGTIMGAAGVSPPWRFWADEMEEQSRNVYQMKNGSITSCDANPPDYQIYASSANVRMGDRARMKNARLRIDETPCFYFPYYTRSLKPKKYSIRVEPGNSSRDGFTNRTTIGYPFSANTYTKFRWDFLERTGDGAGVEHRYFNPNIKGDIDAYYIRDINPDPAPQSKRYSILWNHYQRLTPRLTANAKLDVKSDQVFGNEFSSVGNDVRIENQSRGVISEGGLNYQFPRSALQVQVDRQDKFDSTVSSQNFISKLTLPSISYNTIPINFKHVPFYTSFSSNFTDQTVERTSPLETLRYQRSASTGVQIKRDARISRTLTLTPNASYAETWQDHDFLSTGTSKDVYVGHYTLGTDFRKRVGRSIDTTFSYLYGERFERNRTTLDSAADDHGVETNRLNSSVVSRIGRNTRLSFSSGYNYLRAPRSDPSRFDHQAARLTPPAADVQVQATRTVSLYFRETYQLFDFTTRRNVKTPLNTSGEVAVGNIAGRTYFSQGFSFTKQPTPGLPSDLLLTNKLRFFPSLKWHVDLFVSYRATGPDKLNYHRVLPIEKTIRVSRDLHCWVFRMEFSERPGRKEASFYVDLKANLSSQRNLFAKPSDLPEAPLDVSDVFPEAGKASAPPAAPSY